MNGAQIVFYMILFNIFSIVLTAVEIIPGTSFETGQFYNFMGYNPYNNFIELLTKTSETLGNIIATPTWVNFTWSLDPTTLVFQLIAAILPTLGQILNFLVSIITIVVEGGKLAIYILFVSTVGAPILYSNIFSLIDPYYGSMFGLLIGGIQSMYLIAWFAYYGLVALTGGATPK